MRPENYRKRVGSGQKLNGRNAKERLHVWKQGWLKHVKSEFVSTGSPPRHHANLLTPQIHFDVAPKCRGGLQGEVSHWRVRGKLPFQANRRENYTWRWINPSGPTLLSPSGVRGDQIQASSFQQGARWVGTLAWLRLEVWNHHWSRWCPPSPIPSPHTWLDHPASGLRPTRPPRATPKLVLGKGCETSGRRFTRPVPPGWKTKRQSAAERPHLEGT